MGVIDHTQTTSPVWLDANIDLRNKPPPAITKDKIVPNKIDIYKTVVKSVAPTLKAEAVASKAMSAAPGAAPSGHLYGKYGTVRSVIMNNGHFAGGIIEFGGTSVNPPNYGAFVKLEYYNNMKNNLQVCIIISSVLFLFFLDIQGKKVCTNNCGPMLPLCNA